MEREKRKNQGNKIKQNGKIDKENTKKRKGVNSNDHEKKSTEGK